MELSAKRTPAKTPQRGILKPVKLSARMARSKTRGEKKGTLVNKKKIATPISKRKALAHRTSVNVTPASKASLARMRFRDEALRELKDLDANELQRICREEGLHYDKKIDVIFDIADFRTEAAFAGSATVTDVIQIADSDTVSNVDVARPADELREELQSGFASLYNHRGAVPTVKDERLQHCFVANSDDTGRFLALDDVLSLKNELGALVVAVAGEAMTVAAAAVCRATSCVAAIAKALLLDCACANRSIVGLCEVPALALCLCGVCKELPLPLSAVLFTVPCIVCVTVLVVELRFTDDVLWYGALATAACSGGCLSMCNGVACAAVPVGVFAVGVRVGVVRDGVLVVHCVLQVEEPTASHCLLYRSGGSRLDRCGERGVCRRRVTESHLPTSSQQIVFSFCGWPYSCQL
ncbi:hypothetical protein CBR_g27858 [Chara braunii]|uniref:Uncharacterized protein n=1 Tax=Chara braunii TaxID=69332 RepID=A0A388L8R3_CHABU|nr:hypothetical protein CBR_g27858 [Chara braunii]|eukprot:GBG78632.1 hypothetical protein CBR_g27858 [Chara braunii]